MTSAAAVALVMVTLVFWGVFSARLDRADLSAPIVFVIECLDGRARGCCPGADGCRAWIVGDD